MGRKSSPVGLAEGVALGEGDRWFAAIRLLRNGGEKAELRVIRTIVFDQEKDATVAAKAMVAKLNREGASLP
jgi:hypothetical protein